MALRDIRGKTSGSLEQRWNLPKRVSYQIAITLRSCEGRVIFFSQLANLRIGLYWLRCRILSHHIPTCLQGVCNCGSTEKRV